MDTRQVRRSGRLAKPPAVVMDEPVSTVATAAPSRVRRLLNYTLVPLLLMLLTPNFVMFLYHLTYRYGGHFRGQFFGDVHGRGPRHIIHFLWRGTFHGSGFSLLVVAGYLAWAVVWSVVLPGRVRSGPVTPCGHTPHYKENGFRYYLLTLASFLSLHFYLLSRGLTVTVVVDRFDELLRSLNLCALLLCLFLYVKGRWKPSGRDGGVSGNVIFDFYWGTELYPRVRGVDVKLITNCRVGMMGWALLILCFLLKSYELHGTITSSMGVCVLLQLLYITKFFWWELGYMNTIDISLDRAGYYLCWGCLVFIPGFYTTPTMYLIKNPNHLSPGITALIFIVGVSSLLVNYWADYQKQVCRATAGKCEIWGRRAEVIRAKYTLHDGSIRESILLVSGFWSISRHFHYLPEILLAFCWSVPGMFGSLIPYFNVIFLTILLVHRTYRDDEKCAKKYGIYWKQYREKVPYKMVPFIF